MAQPPLVPWWWWPLPPQSLGAACQWLWGPISTAHSSRSLHQIWSISPQQFIHDKWTQGHKATIVGNSRIVMTVVTHQTESWPQVECKSTITMKPCPPDSAPRTGYTAKTRIAETSRNKFNIILDWRVSALDIVWYVNAGVVSVVGGAIVLLALVSLVS